ncbi:hypothetical protein [Actinophytocola oryzae]|uniref:Uncharacterized protein n=1 Tax=Actinophytocola oryzae TaxID=502181 RepID=A0A4R7W056_9PSEU|nr:hypothetical protein [Actinophytocola oryzae]TDV55318.1 hypothetical protein CLV71_103559 [Actinophytocola oryzae]
MWAEEDLGAALRAELAQQTPPGPHGGLTDAVARGRRRRRRQQLGAALAAVAAVAGVVTVAVSAGALASGGQDVAATGTTPTEAPWPRADLPAHSPYTTWTPAPTAPPPAGRPIEPVPICDTSDTSGRDLDSVRADLPDLQQRVRQALTAVADDATVGLLVELKMTSTRPNTHDAFTYTADVSDAGGTGSVVFSVGRFTGDPLTAADDQAYDLSNCEAPKRRVLGDGTVLQIYDVAPSEPFVSLDQTLRIYRPDGQLYALSVRNFGSPDFATNPADPGHPDRVGAGRPTLPLTEAQLADLGLAIVG